MKREFTIPVTVTAYTKEEAQAQLDLLLQMGAFLKDFNVQNLAGSFISHFMLAKLSQYTQGKMDLSGCYSSPGTLPSTHCRKTKLRKNASKKAH